MANWEKFVEDTISSQVNNDCNKIRTQCVSSLAEKIKAKKKSLEAERLPVVNKLSEITSKSEAIEKKRREVETEFNRSMQGFETVASVLDSAEEDYAKLGKRLLQTESAYEDLKMRAMEVDWESLVQKTEEEGMNWTRATDEGKNLLAKLAAAEKKRDNLKSQLSAVVEEQENRKQEMELKQEEYKQQLLLVAEKKTQYEALLPPPPKTSTPTRDGE